MKKVTRLYEQFNPSHYILNIEPDRDSMTFSGSVVITGKKIGRPSQRLTFHQKDLKITKVHVVFHSKTGDEDIQIVRVNHHSTFDEVRLHSDKMLYPGKYTIRLEFLGKITRPMNGIYPCFFKHDGQNKKLIATQFESHHAREAFPCIDEPEAKAKFNLSLTSPVGESVVSNTPIKIQTQKNDKLQTTFETTPIMSTYLLAFVFGDLEYLESKTKHGVVVRTYATPDNVRFTKFALDVAVKCLEYYSEYFDIDYPLDKCDMVALPDFASGAMENWGCITYREQALLVDPDHTSLGTKQYVAMVVAHELTHQWFGNLVTMQWWTDLWLNEGFASWFEYLALDHLYPNWKMWTQFIVDEQQSALKLDALEHTHAIEVAINHPDEIRTIFDAISYNKGSSVIHMLYKYLGAEDFRDGLRYYLKKHSYKNTITNDLWDALEETSGKPVKEFMHCWTSQPGYPIVHVDIDEKGVSLSQQRFVTNAQHKVKDSSLWQVPLLSNNKEVPEQLNEKELHITLKSSDNFKLNTNNSGFYRTVYNASHLNVLAKNIKTGHMTVLDRLGILADALEAAKAGVIDTGNVLKLLESYRNEDDNAVWDVIATVLGGIKLIMDDDKLRNDMKPFTRKLIAGQLKRLGWESKHGESHFDKLLRPTILSLASASDDTNISERAREFFAEMHTPDEVPKQLKSPGNSKGRKANTLNPDLRGVIYGTIARTGDEADFNKLVTMHNNTRSNEEKINLCTAITSFKQPELIKRALDMITSEHVRLQDVSYWLAYSFTNRYARLATWEWVKSHWDWLESNLGNDLAFYRIPIYVARGFSDDTFIKEYKQFFKKVLSPAFERSYRQGLEMIEWQSAWKKRDLMIVKAYFANTK
ncbi:M1 family metallopeptidase [Candidatus Saccharibacteria bacterium]|nr:M1 family metallopeptidase [Candidatus Saccharibacteria bacterium]